MEERIIPQPQIEQGFHNTKSPQNGGPQKLYSRRVLINSSNLIYVVIILSKLKAC